MLNDNELDDLLSDEEKALLLKLYDAWEQYSQAFTFPPWSSNNPSLSQGEPSTAHLNPPAVQLRTLSQAGLILLEQPPPRTRKGSAPGGSVNSTLAGRRYYRRIKAHGHPAGIHDSPQHVAVSPVSEPRRPNQSNKPASKDNPQARGFRQLQNVTLPEPELQELLKTSGQQWDLIESQGLEDRPSERPKEGGRTTVSVEPEQAERKTRAAAYPAGSATSSSHPLVVKPRLFIVHGSDEVTKWAVKNYLQNRLKLPEPIVLHELPNHGRTLIEKFEDHADEVDGAVVLLTPDDIWLEEGTNEELRRARQNVVFELGYFVGRLGRRSGKILLLYKGALNLPSDITGIAYISIEPGVEAAGEQIRRELGLT